MMKKQQLLWLLMLLFIFNSCSKKDDSIIQVQQLPEPQNTIKVTSSAFLNNGIIPVKYTCNTPAAPYSLPLAWENIPSGTLSFALIMTDLDAVNLPADNCVIYNIPATTTAIVEKLSGGNTTIISDVNAVNVKYYTLPCPKDGKKTHRFQIGIYALNQQLDVPILSYASSNDILAALKGNTLAYGILIGTVDTP